MRWDDGHGYPPLRNEGDGDVTVYKNGVRTRREATECEATEEPVAEGSAETAKGRRALDARLG